MKHSLTFFIGVFFLLTASAQSSFELPDKPFILNLPVDQGLRKQVELEAIPFGLSEDELSFLYWVNYFRQDPKLFYTACLVPFLKQFPQVDGQNAQSLKADLSSIGPLPPFRLNPKLSIVAKEHALDLSLHADGISHTSSTGRTFAMRVQAVGFRQSAAENIYAGKDGSLASLVLLLLDIGVNGLGHRKNLLQANFIETGISIKSHKNGERVILVQEFGSKE